MGSGRRELNSHPSRAPGGAGVTSLPVYHQLYVVLRQRIREGAFPPDRPLPSELQLAQDYDVSRVTVRRTLELLEREGLILRRRGVGTFPVQPSAQTSSAPIAGLVENLITIGLDTRAELLGCETTDRPPPRVVQALGIEDDPRCLVAERLRWHGGEPFSLTTIWVPARVAADLDMDRLGDRPIVALIEDAGYRPSSADQTLSAVLADDRTARLLETSIGAPAISLRRTVRDPSGAPLLHQQSFYHPDRYEYHMLLTRDNTTARPHWRHTG